MDILMFQEQSSSVFRCFAANDSNKETLRPLWEYFNRKYRWIIWLISDPLWMEQLRSLYNPLTWISILRISNPMNPFSKRIHQIKNPDLDLPKGTRNPFLDLKSVSGFTKRNTPIILQISAKPVTWGTFNLEYFFVYKFQFTFLRNSVFCVGS